MLCPQRSFKPDSLNAVQGLAAALLTHDNPAVALGEASGRARLSTLGCAMLATVLRLPKVGLQICHAAFPDACSRPRLAESSPSAHLSNIQ